MNTHYCETSDYFRLLIEIVDPSAFFVCSIFDGSKKSAEWMAHKIIE